MSRVPCVRFGWWLGLLVLGLASSPAAAQTTYTWNTTTTDNAWLNPANWTGGTAGTWPGATTLPNGSSGNTTDLAVIDTFAFPAANGLGIDMDTAGGELSLGAIQFTSGSGNLQIGSSSGAGTLILNGATVNSVANVILANTSATNDLTIANTPAGVGVQTMGLRLGNADNVILVNSGRTITINDVISGAFFNSQPVASTIGIQGGGTVVFGNTNAFTGAVSVTGGSTLSVSSDGNFGQKVASSRVILNNGTLLATGSFTLDSSRPVVIGAPDTAGGSGTISVASSQTLTYGGVIQNAGSQAEQLIKTGAGTLQLGGASTYTGGTAINAGTIQATADNVLASGGTVSLANAAGALFDLNNTNQTIGSLSGGGATGGNVNLGTGTLTLGGDNTSTTFTGLFTGSGTVTKTGTGTLTLRGNSTGWTGPLTVTGGGVVSIDNQTRLNSTGTATGAITLDNGTIQETNSGNAGTFTPTSRNIVLGAGGGTLEYTTAGNLIIVQTGTVISGVGGLTKAGAGIISVVTPATYQGPTHVAAGTLRVRTNNNVFPIGTALTVDSGAIFDLSNLKQQVGSLSGAGSVALGSGTFTVGDTTSTTFSGAISGTGSVTKIGSGTLTLSGANSYTGATTISAGGLTAAKANAFSPVSAVTLANTSGAGLNLQGFDQTIGSLSGGGANGGNVALGGAILVTGGNNSSTTYGGVISDAGTVIKFGTGTLTLTGSNTYSTLTEINSGTLLVNGQTGTQSGTGTSPVAVNGGATLGGNGQAAGAVTVNSLGRIIGGQGTAVNEQLSLGNNLTLANNSTVRVAVGNGATVSDTTLAGSSQVAVTGVLGRATATDRITIDLAFATGGNLDLTGGTTYTRRVATYGSLSNLTPGTYTAADNVFNVTSPSFGVDPGWTVLVGQNGNALDVVFTPVPEPGAVLAIGLAGLGLAGLVRRSRRGGPATLS